MKLTFKEYLDSKQRLREAITNTPTAIVEYQVRKYCTLTVGDSEDDKQMLSLKPSHTLVVEWKYENPSSPTIEKISISGSEIYEDDQFTLFWSTAKFNKWLDRHAKPGTNTQSKR